jgi:transmembrane sensor
VARLGSIGIVSALAVFAAGLNLIVFRPGASGAPTHALLQTCTDRVILSTDIGEQRRFVLGDQSVVILNTDSKVEVDLCSHVRLVRLKRGEGRFVVAKDTTRPFLVHSGGTQVRATGTIFNVHLGLTATAVTVLEGRVEVTSATGRLGSALALNEGEQVEVTRAGSIRSDGHRPYSRAVDWTEGRLTFTDESVTTIVEEMNRYRKAPIRIVDKRVGRERVTGSCRLESVTQGATPLALYEHIRAKAESDGSVSLHWRP